MGGLPRATDPRILVGYATGDDAGVFRLDADTALVQTVDFFTPIEDDPETFGAIAAANALSFVYAMGGAPLTALAIAAFPEEDFPLDQAAAIARGGAAKLAEAGCALLGGHTVRDPEIKFGYAPERLPLLPGLEAVASAQAGGLRANRAAYGPRIDPGDGPSGVLEAALFDPQTSGGLLLSVPSVALDALLADLPGARLIGRVTAAGARPLALVPAAAVL